MPDIQYDASILPAELVAKLGAPPTVESPTQPSGDATKKAAAEPPLKDAPKGIPSPPKVKPAAAPDNQPSKEAINAYLKTLTHDELKEFEAYNAHISRAQAKVQTDHRKAAQIQGKLFEWDTYFTRLSKAALADAREDDKVDAMYRAIKKWRVEGRTVPGLIGNGTPATTDIAAISKKMREYYKTHPEWANIVTEDLWSALSEETDPSKMLVMLADARVKALSKADRESFEDEVKAAVETALAETHHRVTTPKQPKGAAASGQGLTVEQYQKLSPQEARNLTSEEIDQLTREIKDGARS